MICKFELDFDDRKHVGESEVEPGAILLEILEGARIKYPYGCRAGACGVCRIRIIEGLQDLEPRGLVEEDTWARCADQPDVRLACQARVRDSASLKLERPEDL